MRESINYAIFGWYPYLCLTVFLIGSLLRFDREQYTWRSGSSQLLRRRQHSVIIPEIFRSYWTTHRHRR